ncbi:hypothetical protein FA95DRAFT_1285990 [Auriscalpium vulgare]|uniref:Uncharacterized protein n=1 Tax=Auriscalpium vulgare TaxID=40419 RepID=A0ACB8RSG9_9AGAM|nr:hypothetical protein FA95DRAFT_1285990 [Auriscalpium vulgare]
MHCNWSCGAGTYAIGGSQREGQLIRSVQRHYRLGFDTAWDSETPMGISFFLRLHGPGAVYSSSAAVRQGTAADRSLAVPAALAYALRTCTCLRAYSAFPHTDLRIPQAGPPPLFRHSYIRIIASRQLILPISAGFDTRLNVTTPLPTSDF